MSEWAEQLDVRSGQTFFVHVRTGLAVWTRPPAETPYDPLAAGTPGRPYSPSFPYEVGVQLADAPHR